ncbi:MAG: molybdopterin biosynthesis protein molybdenum incorporation step, partial [Massilia sp.]|nr:molybdopterin biosynthesis protein molybdenum incorporation step [Massilia sp.]
ALDCAGGGARLTVSDRIPAGQVGKYLEAGCAARIFTGAMIPDGADAVVMQEQCRLHDDGTVTSTTRRRQANGSAAPARTSPAAR